MPTRKQESTPDAVEAEGAGPSGPRQVAAYEAALARYAAAVELLARQDFAAARDIFREVVRGVTNEPELIQRARGYAALCERHLAPPAAEPASADERYAHAVYLSNAGDWEKALKLFDQVLAEQPNSVRCLYARACTRALKGQTDRAVADLRQAIAADPRVRYQAVNDPDFEKVREEPAFIDIIEPTPTPGP